jgi:hypothetical protein
VIDTAFKFFRLYLPAQGLEVVATGDKSYDIEFKGVELGSYGIRRCDFLTWCFGTAVAEPRLTFTMQKFGIPIKSKYSVCQIS